MPNHFHLLVVGKMERGVSKFMQKLGTAYSMYYNQKYERTGGLFEGKFRSEHLDTDQYLKYIFSYIHLNPVKLVQKDWEANGIKNVAKVINYLDKYPYSSYLDFIGEKRPQSKILNIKPFPRYFPDTSSFNEEIFDWLNIAKQDLTLTT